MFHLQGRAKTGRLNNIASLSSHFPQRMYKKLASDGKAMSELQKVCAGRPVTGKRVRKE
jgi:hypothetical protein